MFRLGWFVRLEGILRNADDDFGHVRRLRQQILGLFGESAEFRRVNVPQGVFFRLRHDLLLFLFTNVQLLVQLGLQSEGASHGRVQLQQLIGPSAYFRREWSELLLVRFLAEVKLRVTRRGQSGKIRGFVHEAYSFARFQRVVKENVVIQEKISNAFPQFIHSVQISLLMNLRVFNVEDLGILGDCFDLTRRPQFGVSDGRGFGKIEFMFQNVLHRVETILDVVLYEMFILLFEEDVSVAVLFFQSSHHFAVLRRSGGHLRRRNEFAHAVFRNESGFSFLVSFHVFCPFLPFFFSFSSPLLMF